MPDPIPDLPEGSRTEAVLPLHAEELVVDKERVERARVRVSTRIVEREEPVRLDLERDDVEVVRVPIDRPVAERPPVREDGDVTIIPLVEEVLVVETRLVLREEIHIRRKKQVQPVERTVTLRSEDAVIERETLSPPNPNEHPEEQS